MSKQKFHHGTPTVLLGLAVLVVAGAAADLSASPLLLCPRTGSLAARDADRDAVAHWLTRLATVAKQMHGQVATVAPQQRGPAFRLNREIASPALDFITIPQPLSQVRSHLIDLPPPTR